MLNDDGMAAYDFLGILMTREVPGSRDSTKPMKMIADTLFPIFSKDSCFNCNQNLYKRSGPSIWKYIDGPHCTVQPIRLQDFAYKHLIRQ